MAIRLGCETRGADLALDENTGNHSSAAPGRRGRRQRGRAAGTPEWPTARRPRGPCQVRPGPALRTLASPRRSAPAMVPRRPASPGVAVAFCWIFTGERLHFPLSISCAGSGGLEPGGRCTAVGPRGGNAAPIHFGALQVAWPRSAEGSVCVLVLVSIKFCCSFRPSRLRSEREAVLKTLLLK